MIIRSEQMRALSLAQQQDFEERAYEYLCESHPDNPAIRKSADLRASIREGIQQAAGYNITREIDVIRFLEFRVALGRGFHLTEKYAEILLREVSAEERLDEIVEHARFGDATE